MRIIFKFLLFLGVVAFNSCIKNDLPYPVIKGEILEIAAENMIEAKINAETRKVTILVSDDTRLDSIYITKLRITEGANLVINPDVYFSFTSFPDTGFVSIESLPANMNTCIKANAPFSASVNMYQDYPWDISIERKIDRIIKVKHQTGTPLVDLHNKIVIIYVDSLLQPKRDNIVIETLQLGSSIAVTTPDPVTVTNFTRPNKFEVAAFEQTETWIVHVMHPNSDDVPTLLSVWSRRAYIRGLSKTRQVEIRYQEEKDSIWDYVQSSEITFDDKDIFTAVMPHLRPLTTYNYELSIDGGDYEKDIFTTEALEEIPNLSFDDWVQEGKIIYAKKGTDPIYWDSGNEGGSMVSVNPTVEEKSLVKSGSAAALKSTAIAGVFAAGNLYSGQFVATIGMEGAEIDFGRPFTGRPSALKGYYLYKPGIIGVTEPVFADLKGTTDSCHIYMALFDWTTPFRVNTKLQTFVDITWDNPNLIAFGEIKTDKATNGYERFTIDLEYKNYFVKPTYVLIVASASKYGDFFTGSTSSELYLDEFELVY